MAPRSGNQLQQMLHAAIAQYSGPVFIRYPRGSTPAIESGDKPAALKLGVPDTVIKGKSIALVGIGDFFELAQSVVQLLQKQSIKPTLVDARFAKPLDGEYYSRLLNTHRLIVTFENNSVTGGFGSGVTELLHSLRLKHKPDIITVGLPDRFIPHGERSTLLHTMSLDAPSIAAAIARRYAAVESPGKKSAFVLPV
jgi:1-deoxy-D-xylulose-5-phosphate synthase